MVQTQGRAIEGLPGTRKTRYGKQQANRMTGGADRGRIMAFRWKAVLLALAIGAGTDLVAAFAVAVPFGLPPALGNDLPSLLAMMLVTALPFLALALLAERSRLLWGSGLAVTFLLWGWYVVMAIDYRADGSNVLAHMGFDVILFFYPFLLTPILAGMSFVGRLWARSDQRI